MRVQSGDENADRRFTLGSRDRRRDGSRRRRLPMLQRQPVNKILGDIQSRRFAAANCAVERPLRLPFQTRREPPGRALSADAMRGHEREFVAGSVAKVGERERQVARVSSETGLERGHEFDSGRRAGQSHAKVAQYGELPFADDPFGHFGHHAQHARDFAVVVGERRIGKGMIGLFGEPRPREIEQQRFVPSGHAGREYVVDARSDVGPDLRPHPI